jgi:hypothetical protein
MGFLKPSGDGNLLGPIDGSDSVTGVLGLLVREKARRFGVQACLISHSLSHYIYSIFDMI